jgi:hypothetical protein
MNTRTIKINVAGNLMGGGGENKKIETQRQKHALFYLTQT